MEPTMQRAPQRREAAERIEQTTFLSSPPGRAWRAISDPEEFGAWFGVKLNGPFEAGRKLTGAFSGERPDVPLEILVERVEPERFLAFRWHPYAVDPDVDYSAEPLTLVTFELEPRGEGVRLTITESGFGRIPEERRAEAFAAHERGWAEQAENIHRYLSLPAEPAH
jgi:uncharacterized protein YndB with AHSA1/START domain